jgi:hypothetical protein
MRRRTAYLLIVLVAAFVFAFGHDVLQQVAPGTSRAVDKLLAEVAGHEDIERAAAPFPPVERRLVIMVAGQSNAGNWGATRTQPSHAGVLNYDVQAGALYRARDPMAGTDGFGGSFMPRLGDLLIDAGIADAVVFVPIAVGSTSVADWTFLAFKDRLAQGAAAAQRAGLAPDVILWQQGESDAVERTPTDFYVRRFAKMIEGLRAVSQAPVLVAIASHCGDESKPGEAAVRAAQVAVVSQERKIYAGPDQDKITDRRAEDDCHMTEGGLAKAAAAWADIIRTWAGAKAAAPEGP